MQDSQPAEQTPPAPEGAQQDAPHAAPETTPEPAPETTPETAPDASPQPAEGAPVDESVIEGGVETLRMKIASLWDSLQSNMLTAGVAIEGAILIAAILPAAFFGPRLRKLIQAQIAPRAPYGILRRAANAFAHLATPIALYIVLQIAVFSLRAASSSTGLISAAVSLLAAWIVIRLVTLVIRSPFWSRLTFYVVWPIAALDAFGVLDDLVRQLQAFSIPLGAGEDGVIQTFSALDFLRTIAVFGVLFWGAQFLNHVITGRINAIDELTVSFKALLSKILNVLLPIVALVAALQIVGFPFGTLAIFGGAVGLGKGEDVAGGLAQLAFKAGEKPRVPGKQMPGQPIGGMGGIFPGAARLDIVRHKDGGPRPEDIEECSGQLHRIEDQPVNWAESGKRRGDGLGRRSMHLGDGYRFTMEKRVLEPQRLLQPADPGVGDLEPAQNTGLPGRGRLGAGLQETNHRHGVTDQPYGVDDHPVGDVIARGRLRDRDKGGNENKMHGPGSAITGYYSHSA